MHNRSAISVCKFFSLSRIPFRISSKIPTPILSRPLTILSDKTHHFYHQTKTSQTHFKIFQDFRAYSTSSVDCDREVDNINLKFAEAREEIESAMDSKETVYFNEEADCARQAVTEVLELYEGLLNKLPESEKSKIQRSMGLKIEQLKAELEQLNE